MDAGQKPAAIIRRDEREGQVMEHKAYKAIKVETEEEGIVIVTLNRPEKRNALSPQLHYEMCEALAKIAEDEDVRVLILTGAGDIAFCGGQDLKEFFAANYDKPKEMAKVGKAAMDWGNALRTFPKATVAMVNGMTFGAGIRILCSCDLAIASEKAVFGLSEINFGIHPGGGSTKLPSEVLSHRNFLYMALTGDPIDATTAERWGLVNRMVPDGELKQATMALARKLAQKDAIALRFTKETFWAVKNLDYVPAVQYEMATGAARSSLQQGQWVKEGIGKFLKKEYKPGFTSYLEKP